MSSLRKKVNGLELSAKKRRQDFDPEDDGFSKQVESDEDSDSDVSVNQIQGREHYEAVGKSKLRKPEKTKLDDQKYGGKAVTRDKIFQDDDDIDALAPEDDEDEDPFAVAGDIGSESEDEEVEEEDSSVDLDGEVGDDVEIDSDEAFEEGEEDSFRGKGFVFRGSGQHLRELPSDSDSEGEDLAKDASLEGSGTSEEDQSDIDMEDDLGDEEENDLSAEDVEGEDDSEEESDENEEVPTARPRPSTFRQTGSTDREKLKALISNDTAALASSLSASLSADAKKGAAAKQQYQIFDRLLDARIKLQKGLTVSNDMYTIEQINDENAQAALQRAEEAALKLYATIESLRHAILEASTTTSATNNGTAESKTSKKRKRPTPPTTQTSTSDLWKRIQDLESKSLPTRRQILDKWSQKTRSAAPIQSSASKLSNTEPTQSNLSAILDTYLLSETSKLQQAASSQTSQTPQPTIPYDDSSFYQSLLRDLIASRASLSSSTDPSSISAQPSSIPILPLKLHPSGNTSKNKRVDTKASKGRKVRYTVHEKLENFMASEGRGNMVGQWNDGAVREFFASLLGQRGVLREDGGLDGNGDGVAHSEVEEEDRREVQALRLFRT